jgi:glycosyltransferase involved in cell wall biosynthesis
MIRLAIIITHPIQYFSHVYRRLAVVPELQIKVFYASRIGLDSYRDPGFGVDLAWDCDLLGGFDHEFLPGSDRVRRLDWKSLAEVRVGESLGGFDPDAVLLNGYAHPVVLRAWRWARSRRRQVLLFGDGNGRSEQRRPWYLRTMKRLALAPVLQGLDVVLSLGEANEQYWDAMGFPASRVQWAPLYQPSPDLALEAGEDRDRARTEVRRELGVRPDQVLVLCAGKFLPWKRTIDVVRAVNRCESLVGAYVGDGPCRRACEEEARSERHRFIGFANIPRLARLYCAADLLCHAAEREPYGMVIAEAAAAGLPIVGTRIVGAIGRRSHGQVGRNAEVFEPRDVDGIVNVLASLAADPERRMAMSRQSRLIAQELSEACVSGVRNAVRTAH